MKKSTKLLVEGLPSLKKYLPVEEKLNIDEIQGLTELEKTMLQLICFFEYPEQNNFNLQELYQNLSNDWLLLALNAINSFFEFDTYLIYKDKHSVIDGGDYLNQNQFIEYLNKNGENYSEAKLSMYIKREIIPEPDLIIAGTKYWLRTTCEKFVRQLKKENKQDVYTFEEKEFKPE